MLFQWLSRAELRFRIIINLFITQWLSRAELRFRIIINLFPYEKSSLSPLK
jgi:hypothetical protein